MPNLAPCPGRAEFDYSQWYDTCHERAGVLDERPHDKGMIMTYDHRTDEKHTSMKVPGRRAALALCLLLPALMGGCPEFRNESVNAIETATRGLFNAALDLYFDQFRTDDVS